MNNKKTEDDFIKKLNERPDLHPRQEFKKELKGQLNLLAQKEEQKRSFSRHVTPIMLSIAVLCLAIFSFSLFINEERNGASEINHASDIDKEIKQLQDELDSAREQLNSVYEERDKVIQEKNELNQELEYYNTSISEDIEETFGSFLVKTLFYDQSVAEVFEFETEMELINGWYHQDGATKLIIKGYEDAESVTFYTAVPETDAGIIEIGYDDSPEDGWVFNEEITSSFTGLAFWGEIKMKNADIVRTPLLPIKLKKD